MKHRLIDLLQCSCGKSALTLENPVVKTVPFSDTLSEVRCSNTCSFKKCANPQGKVSASDCTACYSQEIMEGTLRCECGRTRPIIGGIPRLLPDDMSTDIKRTQDTFTYEWKMFRFGDRNWGQDISFRKEQFLRGIALSPSDMKGKLMFDAGCGSGLLSIEMAKSFGMEVVALDLAYGIENAYRNNTSPYVYFVQGSVLEPPVRDRVFDYIYCCGVLIALPDTKTGFVAISRTIKPSGRCFTWYYHPISPAYYPDTWRKMALYNWIRVNITSRLPIKVQYYLYLSCIPAFLIKQKIEVLSGRIKNPRKGREKMQALFDFFSAPYQHRHEPPEVVGWYEQQGFSNVKVAYREAEGFAVRGDRS